MLCFIRISIKEEKIFRQEGWHYELESKTLPLIYNGVYTMR